MCWRDRGQRRRQVRPRPGRRVAAVRRVRRDRGRRRRNGHSRHPWLHRRRATPALRPARRAATRWVGAAGHARRQLREPGYPAAAAVRHLGPVAVLVARASAAVLAVTRLLLEQVHLLRLRAQHQPAHLTVAQSAHRNGHRGAQGAHPSVAHGVLLGRRHRASALAQTGARDRRERHPHSVERGAAAREDLPARHGAGPQRLGLCVGVVRLRVRARSAFST